MQGKGALVGARGKGAVDRQGRSSRQDHAGLAQKEEEIGTKSRSLSRGASKSTFSTANPHLQKMGQICKDTHKHVC